MSDRGQRLLRRANRNGGASGAARRPRFAHAGIAIAVSALVVTAGVSIPRLRPAAPEPATLTYSQLVDSLEAGRVAALTLVPGEEIRGRWRGGETAVAPGADRAASDARAADFVTVYPVDAASESLLETAAAARAQVAYERPRDAQQTRQLLAIGVQVLLIAGIAYILFLNLRSQGGDGRVGERDAGAATTFDDVAGTQGAAEELREVVEFLKAPAAFTRLGARVPRGVLLFGPPGTGKTLMARAVAGEAGVPFFHIPGSEVTGFIVGLGAQRIRSLFRKARKRGGVVFIDELDALGGARGRNRSHNEDDRTLNQLLVEMDGFSPADGVVVIGATNRPEDLDPALKRPGRFDRMVPVALPTAEGRAAILALHVARRNVPLAGDVDLDRLGRLTPGASGADLANLVNEAAIAAVRAGADRVDWSHFDIARDRMLLGKERVGFRARDEEWRIVAVHEAGHALAGVIACPEDGLHKVTIQPRGQAMGVAHFAPDDDRHLHSRAYLEAQIIEGLGGRAAEELVFGADRVTGGAESDLVHVNRIARQMVYRLGMGGSGLLVHDDAAPLSAEYRARMDAEVHALLDRLYDSTRALLADHRAALDALANALLERETLDGPEALEILRRHGVMPALERAGSGTARNAAAAAS